MSLPTLVERCIGSLDTFFSFSHLKTSFILTLKPNFNLLLNFSTTFFQSIILEFATMSSTDQHNLALLAELVTPAVRADNQRLSNRNKELCLDLRRLTKTCRDVAHQNFDLQDQVAYLEAQLARLVSRVHLLESSILDCDDPVHEHPRSVRRRLNYDSGSDLETHDYLFEVIDLTTDEVLTP